jgi:hypothetical protein
VATNFIALYRGESIANARLIAVSSEPEIVSRFLREMAGETEDSVEQIERETLRLVGCDEE